MCGLGLVAGDPIVAAAAATVREGRRVALTRLAKTLSSLFSKSAFS